jgi:hypothetical protein
LRQSRYPSKRCSEEYYPRRPFLAPRNGLQFVEASTQAAQRGSDPTFPSICHFSHRVPKISNDWETSLEDIPSSEIRAISQRGLNAGIREQKSTATAPSDAPRELWAARTLITCARVMLRRNLKDFHPLEKRPLGLFRSLLHQLLQQQRHLLATFLPKFRTKRDTLKLGWEWQEGELCDYFSDVVISAQISSMIVFIDALDECE